MTARRGLRHRPGVLTAARWLLGIGALVLLVVGLDGAEIATRIGSANGVLVAIGVLGLTMIHAVGAAAWMILCRQLGGLRLGWTAGLRVYYSAQALGGVTPANIGGDAYRVVVVRKAGLGWGAAVAPVLVQRATSYLALTLLAIPALALLSVSSRVPQAILGGGIVLCGVAAGLAVTMLVAPARLAAFTSRMPWSRGQAGTGVQFDPAAWARPPNRSVAVATGLGVAFHLGSVLLTALLVAAVDPAATGLAVLAAITIARLSLAVPILPSGLGANEAILALLFGERGIKPRDVSSFAATP